MPFESAITNGIARVAEGALKPPSDFTPAVVKWAIEKIATTVKFTQEMLEDFPQFTTYITSRWIELLKQAEDDKLIYGSGSNDIKGLAITASAYVDTLANTAVDHWMVLDAAATQVQTSGFTPNYILVHPTTAMQIRQNRESTKGFIIDPTKPMAVNGATIIPHPTMTPGDFLVGDFTAGAMLWDRKAANITFFDQNEDDAKKNLILAVVEERLALVTYNENAFVFGDFTSALATGSGA
jgi:HK97 family phage major capsid protein